MSDLLAANLAQNQTNIQPAPVTIAASTTIAPSTMLTFVSGTTPNLKTITPYVTGQHQITIVFTGATPPTLLTTGNIAVGTTTLVQNRAVIFSYDPLTAKYYF